MLRGVLSRIIERVLTIDRLLFMHEAGIDKAYAEEVFNPTISPRSFAVVAPMPVGMDCDLGYVAAEDECSVCT